MKIKWLGHASFLIESQDRQKIITDPYTVGNGINYRPIDESADIVTLSHGHSDHNNAKTIKGNPTILKETGCTTAGGMEFKTVSVYHDEAKGSKRGSDLIFCFRVDGMNLCHAGDLGHLLSAQQLADIGPVDILFIPVGGYYTIDAKEATAVVESVKPNIIFPMHYKTAKTDYPIAGVAEFLKGKKNVRRLNSSELEIRKEILPRENEIIIMPSAY
jgi:L-ascorbate metabolism protein UlaG (beta-lactamase superfamily)